MALAYSLVFFDTVSEDELFLFLVLLCIGVIGSDELFCFWDLDVWFLLLRMEVVSVEGVFGFVLDFYGAAFLDFGFGFILFIVLFCSVFDGFYLLEMIFF